jgi:hypothetical protein
MASYFRPDEYNVEGICEGTERGMKWSIYGRDGFWYGKYHLGRDLCVRMGTSREYAELFIKMMAAINRMADIEDA